MVEVIFKPVPQTTTCPRCNSTLSYDWQEDVENKENFIVISDVLQHTYVYYIVCPNCLEKVVL